MIESLLGRIGELEARVVPLEATVTTQAAEIRRLEALVAAQAAEIERLRAGGGALGVLGKTPQNSSLPPSAAVPANRPATATGKKRGARKGHRGISRCRATPDLVVECRPEQCRGCGEDLTGLPGWVRGRSQQTELPPVRPVVIEVVRYACTCPTCGRRNVAAYPEGWNPRQRFGPRLQTVLAYLHHHQHVSYERLAQLLGHLFGVFLSEGAIAASLARTAGLLQPTYQAIRDQVRQSPVVGSDETRQRLDGKSCWSWVVQSATAAYHWVGERRAAQELVTFFGEENPIVPEVQVSDCYSAQLASPAAVKQVCMAHQLRDLRYAEERGDAVYAPKMARLVRIAIRLAERRSRLPAHRYEHQAARLRRLGQMLGWKIAAPNPFGVALQARYQRLEPHWWVFLERPDVPPTNNASERALRPVVVHRKVSGGFRSGGGAKAYVTFVSIAQTAQKQGGDLWKTLLERLMPHDLLAMATSRTGR
jgi:transposase